MPTIHEKLTALANEFAESVLTLVLTSSLDDLGGERVPTTAPPRSGAPRARAATAHPTGRLPRRTAEQIATAVADVVQLLDKNGPMRSEQIQTALGLGKREIPRVLKAGTAEGAITRKGNKRATIYSAATKRPPAKKAGKTATPESATKKPAKKPATKRATKTPKAVKKTAKKAAKPASKKPAPKTPKTPKTPKKTVAKKAAKKPVKAPKKVAPETPPASALTPKAEPEAAPPSAPTAESAAE